MESGGFDIELGRKATADPEPDSDEDAPSYRQPGRGCSELEVRGICFPSQDGNGGYYLGISSIPLCGQNYLSGIRVLDSGKHTAVGLVVNETEPLLELQSGDSIQRLEVVMAATGVVGLNFVICRQSGLISQHLIGKTHEFESDTKLVRLAPKVGKCICGLGLGFDVCFYPSPFPVGLVEVYLAADLQP